MKAKLIGKITMDFTTENGDRINGTKIHTVFDSDNPDFEGMETASFFIKSEIPLPEMKPESIIDISFNRKGKPEKITLMKA